MNNQLTPKATNGRVTSQKPTHDEIAAKAYELYVENGRQEGRSMENWLGAEQLLTQAHPHPTTTPVKPSQSPELHPADSRQQPYAREERGSASREEIRRQTSPMRPASRQSLRPPERSRQER